MMLLLLLAQNPNWWPTYGADLANTHFSPLKGAMSSAPSIVWQYSGVGYVERSPATAEIGDGDNNLETLVPGYYTGEIALVEGASQTVEWTYNSSSSHNPICTAAMYDVDNDPQLECFITHSGGTGPGLVCLDGLSGSLQWSSTRGKSWGSPKVAELVASNAGLEIVVPDSAGVFCFDAATGTQLWSNLLGLTGTTPALADVDGDGLLEIGVVSRNTVAVLEGETGAIKWSHSISAQYSSPTLFDVTGDGVPDLLAGDTSSNTLLCYDGNTGALHWSVPTLYGPEGGTAAWDIDNDGHVEVIAGCANNGNTGGELYCIDGPTGNVDWTYPVNYGVHRAVSLVDVNSDGQVEILMPGCNATDVNSLKCLTPTGSLLWELYLSSAHDIHDPSNADYDNDGCAELILGTYGVNSAWFLDDPNDSTGCGLLGATEPDIQTGMGYARPEISANIRTIMLRLPADAAGELCLYDVSGRKRAVLFSGQLSKGEYRFEIPELQPGIYTASFQSNRGIVSTTLQALPR